MKKGITLVALVVTIIILLILATVTIGLILGENSLFGRAQEGKDKTELTQVGERMQSAGASALTDQQVGVLDKNVLADVQAQLRAYNSTDSAAIVLTGSGGSYTMTVNSADNKFQLVYTIDFNSFRSDYTIQPIP